MKDQRTKKQLADLNSMREASKISIRGVDRDLYQRARMQALKERLSMGDWINKILRKILGNDA